MVQNTADNEETPLSVYIGRPAFFSCDEPIQFKVNDRWDRVEIALRATLITCIAILMCDKYMQWPADSFMGETSAWLGGYINWAAFVIFLVPVTLKETFAQTLKSLCILCPVFAAGHLVGEVFSFDGMMGYSGYMQGNHWSTFTIVALVVCFAGAVFIMFQPLLRNNMVMQVFLFGMRTGFFLFVTKDAANTSSWRTNRTFMNCFRVWGAASISVFILLLPYPRTAMDGLVKCCRRLESVLELSVRWHGCCFLGAPASKITEMRIHNKQVLSHAYHQIHFEADTHMNISGWEDKTIGFLCGARWAVRKACAAKFFAEVTKALAIIHGLSGVKNDKLTMDVISDETRSLADDVAQHAIVLLKSCRECLLPKFFWQQKLNLALADRESITQCRDAVLDLYSKCQKSFFNDLIPVTKTGGDIHDACAFMTILQRFVECAVALATFILSGASVEKPTAVTTPCQRAFVCENRGTSSIYTREMIIHMLRSSIIWTTAVAVGFNGLGTVIPPYTPAIAMNVEWTMGAPGPANFEVMTHRFLGIAVGSLCSSMIYAAFGNLQLYSLILYPLCIQALFFVFIFLRFGRGHYVGVWSLASRFLFLAMANARQPDINFENIAVGVSRALFPLFPSFLLYLVFYAIIPNANVAPKHEISTVIEKLESIYRWFVQSESEDGIHPLQNAASEEFNSFNKSSRSQLHKIRALVGNAPVGKNQNTFEVSRMIFHKLSETIHYHVLFARVAQREGDYKDLKVETVDADPVHFNQIYHRYLEMMSLLRGGKSAADIDTFWGDFERDQNGLREDCKTALLGVVKELAGSKRASDVNETCDVTATVLHEATSNMALLHMMDNSARLCMLIGSLVQLHEIHHTNIYDAIGKH